ncbi:hypothetical protein [uncultured Roseibium sp.]|uniref:hypothetical protein n=1 Tax=uncultured Roseibium sp. TaxID=1936171 RepID=UPI00260C7704|nr:hypothetical protein [uncultured Roseibium sp.]
MSLQVETDAESEAVQNLEQLVHDWFLAILAEHSDKQINTLLGISSSKLWKLKNGHQRLQAVELLLLHQGLGIPLPKTVRPADNTSVPVNDNSDGPARPTDTKKLFDFAYNRVCDLENRKPAALRANAFERLEQTFHILKTVQGTPEALEIKDLT